MNKRLITITITIKITKITKINKVTSSIVMCCLKGCRWKRWWSSRKIRRK